MEVCEGDFLGVVDHAVDFEEVFVCVDFGDAAVVADEEVFVGGDFGLGLSVLCIHVVFLIYMPLLNGPVENQHSATRYSSKPLTLGGSPLYGNCNTWIISGLFSFCTYFHEISGRFFSVGPIA